MARKPFASSQPTHNSASQREAHLLLIGASYRTCSLEDRDRLQRKSRHIVVPTSSDHHAPWSDVVLLATCNRVEVYVLTKSPNLVSHRMRKSLGVSSNDQSLYVLDAEDAAAHLIRVASGLDSVAEGEQQVTEQVRNAPKQLPSPSADERPLEDLFLRAAKIAPRIRRLAGVRPEDASASHAAIRFLQAAVPLENPTVALIGTGKMARIAAQALRGRARVEILNRDVARARQLAKILNGEAVPLRKLSQVLAEADVVVAATASQAPLVTARGLRAAMHRRDGRPIWLIDLGFPRNVDPTCRSLAGVHLLDLDGLAPWGRFSSSPTAQARVEARIREEAERMVESLRPTASADVASFRKTAEALRRQEVAEALGRLPELSKEGQTVVDRLATRLVNRLLHAPTRLLYALPEGRCKELIREMVSGLQGGSG